MIERGEITGAIGFIAGLAFVLFLAVVFAGCGSACGGLGSCIEIGDEPEEAPSCEVADECVGEAILDLCPPVVEPEACPAPTVQVIVVYADPETDECDLTVPVGHRPIECRGKDHAR